MYQQQWSHHKGHVWWESCVHVIKASNLIDGYPTDVADLAVRVQIQRVDTRQNKENWHKTRTQNRQILLKTEKQCA